MRMILRAAAVVALTATFGACGDDTAAPPVPGALLLSLTTAASDDAAVLVRVTGPGITGVQPASSGQQLFWRLVSDEEARAIVVGGIQSGPLLTVQVPDVNQLADYTAELGEVADSSNTLRTVDASYSLTLTRVGGTR